MLSQRVAAYAGEINRLKRWLPNCSACSLAKSSEKLREKTACQVREAEERIGALQEEMAEVLGEQHDPALPQPLRQSSARKPLPALLPRETRILPPAEITCPACGGDLSPLGCDVSEQLELISSAFKVIETQRPKLACCRCDHSFNPHAVKAHRAQLRGSRPAGPNRHGEVRRTHTALPAVRNLPSSGRGAEPGHAGPLVRLSERTAGAAVTTC